jgi:hypothetical protein
MNSGGKVASGMIPQNTFGQGQQGSSGGQGFGMAFMQSQGTGASIFPQNLGGVMQRPPKKIPNSILGSRPSSQAKSE